MNLWGKDPREIEAERFRAMEARKLGQYYADAVEASSPTKRYATTLRAVLFTSIGGLLMAAVLLVALFFAAKF